MNHSAMAGNRTEGTMLLPGDSHGGDDDDADAVDWNTCGVAPTDIPATHM